MIKTRKRKDLTVFEWKVLKATLEIPLGQTRTYQWVAKRVGSPKAVRAVGQALRKNPFPLILPCHRVVKSDGTLGGYGGTYSARKGKLLKWEQEILKKLT
jgi:methylated-DNA-[protein]-cysteine S-methyltransferase